MKKFIHLLAAAVSPIAVASAQVAFADDAPIDLDNLAVTARGYETPLSQTPGGTGVVTEDDIFRAKKDSIADALADLPGINTSGDSQWGRDVSIRGMSGTSVVVLIDGKRINTATDINARLGLINPMDVERVEVLKGPVSALYGSGSTGGVINIITRKGHFSDDPGYHGRAAVSATTNGAGADTYGNIHYDGKDVWLLASGGMRDHTNFSDGAGNDVRNSKFQDGQIRLAGGFKPTDRLTIELSALRTDATNVGIPGGPSTLPSTGRVTYPRTTNTLISADATLDVGGDLLKQVSASLYYNLIERRVRVDELPSAQANLYLEPAANHATVGGGLQGQFESGDHVVVTGFDGWSWTMESLRRQYRKTGAVVEDKPTPDARQTSLGVYAEDTYALAPAWTLNFGGRFDHLHTRNADNTTATGGTFQAGEDDDVGWNLHAGATWEMGGPWTQTVLLGSSYRAADLLERFKYINLSSSVVLWGNPDLKPETTLFGEWGLSYRTDTVQSGVRVFANKIYDYITEKEVSATRREMTNVGEARILGIELDGRWTFVRDWNLHGDVTALDGRDETADQPLRYISPVVGKVGLGYERDGWFASVDERFAAPQTRTPTGVAHVGGHATTHVAGGYAFEIGQTRHKVALALDNLFDAQYDDYLTNARGYSYAEPGFAATVSYSVEF